MCSIAIRSVPMMATHTLLSPLSAVMVEDCVVAMILEAYNNLLSLQRSSFWSSTPLDSPCMYSPFLWAIGQGFERINTCERTDWEIEERRILERMTFASDTNSCTCTSSLVIPSGCLPFWVRLSCRTDTRTLKSTNLCIYQLVNSELHSRR